jgi:beta-galactosidase GanA
VLSEYTPKAPRILAPGPDAGLPSSHFDKRPAPHNHDEEKTIMAGYAVFDLLQVTDSAKMDEYRQKVRATIEKHGGRVVVAGGKFEVVEGSAKPTSP